MTFAAIRARGPSWIAVVDGRHLHVSHGSSLGGGHDGFGHRGHVDVRRGFGLVLCSGASHCGVDCWLRHFGSLFELLKT